jgi:hypothetical protein
MASHLQREGMARLLAKAEVDHFFLAYRLRSFAEIRSFTDAQLAEFLHCKQDALPRLGLCRCPESSAPSFADDIIRIAGFAPCDSNQLVNVLRETEGIMFLRQITTNSTGHNQLLAARDRQENEEHSNSDDREKSGPGASGE